MMEEKLTHVLQLAETSKEDLAKIPVLDLLEL